MDALRIQNLRSLADTGFLQLTPITLLVGKNSSGKSTFLRTLPLLRQSVEARTTGPVLWYGNFVDFGGFREALRSDAEKDTIALEFQFTIPGSRRTKPSAGYSGSDELRVLEDLPITVALELSQDSEDKATRACAVEVSFAEHSISMRFDVRHGLTGFHVNSLDVLGLGVTYHPLRRTNFVPIIYPTLSGSSESVRWLYSASGRRTLLTKLTDEFASTLGWHFHGNTSRESIKALLPDRGIGSDERILADIRAIRIGGEYWRRKSNLLTTKSPTFHRVRDLILANAVPALLDYIDSYIAAFSSGIKYIAPVRATAERYYRPQNLAIDEVDFEGRNLPIFIESLSGRDRISFQEWVQGHFGLMISTTLVGGHISIRVIESQSGTEYNLADVGFGFSQILPVIAQLWSMIRPERRRVGISRFAPLVLAIEQPELHLHPSMQARVADLIVDAVTAARSIGADLRVVAETHSEAIINRIGARIYEKTLQSSDVSVVIFEKEPLAATQIRVAAYDDDGYLVNWPLGFFEPDHALESR